MLWLKGWLETRWRIAFAIAWGGFLFWITSTSSASLEGRPLEEQWQIILSFFAFLWVIVPVLLAGTGIQTVSVRPMRSSKGLEGSTMFTLSLPVSRGRLFAVRTTLGLIETLAVLAALNVAAWVIFQAPDSTAADTLGHFVAAGSCSLAVYAFATCLSAFLDEGWHTRVTMLAIMILWVLALGGRLPEWVNIFMPIVQGSPLITHEFPWTTIGVAVVLSVSLMAVALKVVRTRDF